MQGDIENNDKEHAAEAACSFWVYNENTPVRNATGVFLLSFE